LFVFLILFLSLPGFSKSNFEISQSPKWMKLLHYKKTLTGGFESEADGKGFFLSSVGKTDPLQELESAIAAFKTSSTPDDEHAICKFPLRFKWLNQELGMPWKADISGCKTYISFFAKLAAKRASIVFSSYYLNNPNTAFGHTLLRLSRYDDLNETEMLDYGINYAAEARENNPFLYAIKGLVGGFKGRFTAIPYYYKIREYSNSEFRDLWSYDLKLTMPQVFEMVDHIWELGQTHFDYYYFHENCSYHLLSLLDVVMPEKNLTGDFKYFTIPADTVRYLHVKGLITEGKKRESTYSKLLRLSQKETQKSLDLAQKIAKNPEKTSTLIDGQKDQKASEILDVAMEAFDYYNSDHILGDDPKTKERKSFLLKARAMNPIITKDDEGWRATEKDSPAYSHAPTRVGVYGAYENRNGIGKKFEWRTSFHDMLDPQRGSLKDGQLELGKLNFSFQKKKFGNEKLRFDEFSIVSIKNFPGQNFWSSPSSWEVDIGVKQLNLAQCFDCPESNISGSMGNTIHLFQRKWLISFLMNGDLGVQNFYDHGYRVGVGPKIFSRYLLSDKIITALTATYHLNTFSEQTVFGEWETRYHLSRDVSLAFKMGSRSYQRIWNLNSQVGLQYFF
jgi:Domain of unknown function (DUF4105)